MTQPKPDTTPPTEGSAHPGAMVSEPKSVTPPSSRVVRLVFLGIGLVCFGVGIVGVFLPVLPTTPFVLLAVACFARSSPRLEQAILDHPVLGPPVRDWRERRVIRPRAKAVATIMIVIVGTISLYYLARPELRTALTLILVACLIFIWTRKSQA